MIKFLREGLILNLPILSEALQLSSSKFEVTKVLDGGMGTCAQIKACDDSVYAIKMIHPDLFLEEDSTQRYIEELKKWLTLSACNGIVEALLMVRVNEIPCIVSSWMKGGDLTPYITRTDKDLFYRTIDRIATTLKWAYEKHSIIHRDLKPQNILLDEKLNAYVGDWGLAKDLSQKIEEKEGTVVRKGSASQTINGTFLGTVTYAAPEQILGKKDIDFRADIYSLGCMMYEWETGHIPFFGKTIEEIATKQVYELPKRITGFLGFTKYKVEDMIYKCLQKNPTNRYQSYDEFLSDFHKVAAKYSEYKPFQIQERYRTARIGVDEFSDKMRNEEINKIKGSKGHALVDIKDIEPYLIEAQQLLELKEYKKASDILERFVNIDLFRSAPDSAFVQNVVINLAFAYNELRRINESLALLGTLENAQNKPAAYYANFGQALVLSRQYEILKNICIEGLNLYPRDPNIQGNLTYAYMELGLLDDALLSAQKRLKMGRDLASVRDAAHVCFSIGMKYRNTDFPLAIRNYITAAKLDHEVLALNPKYTNARYNLANTLFYLKQYSESSSEVQKLREMEGGVTAQGAFLIARNLLWLGCFKETYEFTERLLKTFPDNIRLKRVRAEALADGYSIGYVNDDGLRIVEPTSLDFFEKIVDDERHREPSDIIYLAKYYLWMSEGDISMREKSIGLLKWGKSIYIDDWRFDFYLASSYSLISELQQALVHAQEAIRKAPWRDTAYNLCSQIYAKMGELNKSSEMKQKAEHLKEQKNKLYQEAKTL